MVVVEVVVVVAVVVTVVVVAAAAAAAAAAVVVVVVVAVVIMLVAALFVLVVEVYIFRISSSISIGRRGPAGVVKTRSASGGTQSQLQSRILHPSAGLPSSCNAFLGTVVNHPKPNNLSQQ